MKKIFWLAMAASALMWTSCSEDWNKHYDGNVVDEETSPLTLEEYFKSESDYSKFYRLLDSAGVAGELGRNQHLTVWAVKNDKYNDSEFSALKDSLLGKYHVCNLAFSVTNLRDGLRILCLNGIYVTISQDGAGFEVNNFKILSSKRFKNGIVHEISGLMRPLTNVFDYIGMLDDSYSIIRDSIIFYNRKVFDRENSTPVSVDQSGNTVYDSVFYYTNPLFDKVNLSSEFEQFTMFLPSNSVIETCLNQTRAQYELMAKEFTQADTILAITWIKETMFQKGLIKNYHEEVDLSSPFHASTAKRVWRTSVQEVDENDVDELSNGLVYKVTKLKIPNNVLITRIKSLAHYYEYLSAEDKAALYTGRGLLVTETSTGWHVSNGDATPIAPNQPAIYYILQAKGITKLVDGVYAPEEEQEEFYVDFPPIDYNQVTREAKVMKVPVGEYNLYMGFRSKDHAFVDIYFHSGAAPIPDGPGAQLVMAEIDASKSSPWNYDRVNEVDPNISRWNGLGGLVGVVTVEGDNAMETFRIRVKFNKQASATRTTRELQIYHWCLKPTDNNY
ncbi:MAG: fasciclin domain-containing protein [Bacteroidales bacterium]|jgi:hypothetical protein|nr:fasciclin domain-containing protein [Bacteroidales bacterium]